MRRAKAILVLLTLATLPLVPLVQASRISACACGCACCVRHPMRSENSARGVRHTGMLCHRDAAGHLYQCGMQSRHRNADMLGPIPPTMLSSVAGVAPPSLVPSDAARVAQHPGPQFSTDFFQPPRA